MRAVLEREKRLLGVHRIRRADVHDVHPSLPRRSSSDSYATVFGELISELFRARWVRLQTATTVPPRSRTAAACTRATNPEPTIALQDAQALRNICVRTSMSSRA